MTFECLPGSGQAVAYRELMHLIFLLTWCCDSERGDCELYPMGASVNGTDDANSLVPVLMSTYILVVASIFTHPLTLSMTTHLPVMLLDLLVTERRVGSVALLSNLAAK